MGLFGSKKQTNPQEDYEKRVREKEEDRIEEAISKVLIFPGSLEKFEEMIGYKCIPIQSGDQDQGIILTDSGDGKYDLYEYDYETRKWLVDTGIVAIVNAQPVYDDTYENSCRYGLPVKRKI